MTEQAEPLYTSPGGLMNAKGRAELGFITLLVDRVVFVPNKGSKLGMLGGIGGVLLAQRIAKGSVIKSANEAAPGTVSVPLADIQGVKPGSARNARNFVCLVKRDGSEVLLSARYKDWQPFLKNALAGTDAVVA